MLRRLLDDMIRDVVFMWAHSFFRDVVDAWDIKQLSQVVARRRRMDFATRRGHAEPWRRGMEKQRRREVAEVAYNLDTHWPPTDTHEE
jgi:hypothetical protein